jgi:hypothetical protein
MNLEILWDSNSQNGNSLGSVKVHSLTFSYTLGNMKCDFQTSLLVPTFASPYFGCEPKIKVVTEKPTMTLESLVKLVSAQLEFKLGFQVVECKKIIIVLFFK